MQPCSPDGENCKSLLNTCNICDDDDDGVNIIQCTFGVCCISALPVQMCDQVVEIIREERGKLVVTSLQIMRGSKCPDNAGVEVIRGSQKIAVIQGKPSSTP